jgi:hypothetical protein
LNPFLGFWCCSQTRSKCTFVSLLLSYDQPGHLGVNRFQVGFGVPWLATLKMCTLKRLA